jgi:ArsR family transcriptional regulator
MSESRTETLGADRAVQFKALADATRLAVLTRLSTEPTCVCELADGLGVSQPLLSFHLRTLRDAGLVRVTRRGRWSYYALDTRALDSIARTLATLTAPADGAAVGACCDPAARV